MRGGGRNHRNCLCGEEIVAHLFPAGEGGNLKREGVRAWPGQKPRYRRMWGFAGEEKLRSTEKKSCDAWLQKHTFSSNKECWHEIISVRTCVCVTISVSGDYFKRYRFTLTNSLETRKTLKDTYYRPVAVCNLHRLVRSFSQQLLPKWVKRASS